MRNQPLGVEPVAGQMDGEKKDNVIVLERTVKD